MRNWGSIALFDESNFTRDFEYSTLSSIYGFLSGGKIAHASFVFKFMEILNSGEEIRCKERRKPDNPQHSVRGTPTHTDIDIII